MDFLDNMKMGRKLIGSFLIVIILLMVIAIIGFFGIQSGKEGIDKTYDLYLLGMQHLGDGKSALLTMRGDVFGYIAYPDERKNYATAIEEAETEFSKAIDTYISIKTDPVKIEKAKDVQAKFKSYSNSIDSVFLKVDENKMDDVQKMTVSGGEAPVARQAVVESINELRQMEEDDAENYNGLVSEQSQSSTIFISILSIFAIVISLALAFTLTRSITQPCSKVNNLLTEMSKGHLSERLNLTRKDELGEMARTMDIFADELQHKTIEVIHRIAEGERVELPALKDSKDEIASAIFILVTTFRGLTDETSKLINAANAGDLSARGDDSHFKGRFKDIISGINETLESVILPVKEAMRLSKEYANGNLIDRVDTNLVVAGDFIEFKNALNHLVVPRLKAGITFCLFSNTILIKCTI